MSEKKHNYDHHHPNSTHIKKQQHWLSTTEETRDDGGGGVGTPLHQSSTDRRRSQKWLWDLTVGSLRLCVTGWQGVKRKTKIYIERGREEGIKREKERVALFFFAEHIDTPFVSLAHSNLHTQYAAAVW